MSRLRFGASLYLSLILLIAAGTVSAATLHVNCAAKEGMHSIGAALKVLRNVPGPNTINVSGACNEDVVIQSMDRVTLNAVNGASINDPSQGANVTLVIDDSRSVTINNFVINGYAAGTSGNDVVDCQDASVCFFNGDTVQNAPQGGGLGVWSGSYADIEGGFLQNNSGWTGLAVFRSAKARAQGVTSQGNWRGAIVAEGGHLQLNASTVANNADIGILLRQGAALVCNQCTVTGNGSHGVNVEENSVASFLANSSVTNNVGAGINLTNLSSASFWDGTGNVTNNNGGQGDLVCNPKYTTTAGLPATVGKVVNCP
jgi:hypothetical protein